MKQIRVFLLTVFATLLGLTFAVIDGSAQPNSVKEIVPGVWFREGDIKGQGHCNNAIIEMQDSLIVVDANFPSGARLALEDAKKVSKKPVKYVFDTHHHGDHAYGNAVWTKAGAITLAHHGVVEEMKRYEPKRWQDTAKQRADVGELGLSTAEPPKETFTKSPHVISDSTRRVEFHFFGWAHTRGDGFVYLPKEQVVATGDAVVNGPYNFTGDGNIGNWPKVIAKVQKLKVRHVLPGHGPHGGPEVLEGQKQFFLELYKQVRAGVKGGKKAEEIAKSVQFPDRVKNWVGGGLPAQVRDAHKELTAK